MILNFVAALMTLGANAAFRIINGARPPSDYLLEQFLPEENRPTYHAQGGNMVIRATMAGLVGMDSSYPPGGAAEASDWNAQTAKVANEVPLSEHQLRTLQDLLMRAGILGDQLATNERLADEALNFFELVIMQPHFDTAEWLRGQALQNGVIDWTFNKKRLFIDYQLPAANFLPERTVAGGEAYHLPGSVFWNDIRQLRRTLRGQVRAIIAHPDTIDAIRYNPANQLATVGESGSSVVFRRFARNSAGEDFPGQFSADAADVVTLVGYDREGEVINPANPDTTLILPFINRGHLVAIGNNNVQGYVPGRGSQGEDPDDANRLGYTHIGPTVEGGGQMGRWGDMYVPQERPYQLRGRAVTNIAPVIEAPQKIARATTELPA